MHRPNANSDDVAFKFRNKLMPVRSGVEFASAAFALCC